MHRSCWKTLWVFAALVVGNATSHAQPVGPSQCDASPRAPLAQLQKLKETLERDVTAGQANGQEKDRSNDHPAEAGSQAAGTTRNGQGAGPVLAVAIRP